MEQEQPITDATINQRQIELHRELKAYENAERKVQQERMWAMQQDQFARATRERAVEKAMAIKGQDAANADPEALVALAMRLEQYFKQGS